MVFRRYCGRVGFDLGAGTPDRLVVLRNEVVQAF